MQVRLKNRKEQIIKLALELIQTKGFDSFSYQDLAHELGITKASIHHHFPKKEDLGVALCQAIQTWHELEFARVRSYSGTTVEKLELYISSLLSYACGKNKVCPLSSLQADITSLPQSMQPALKKLDDHELNFITELLEQGRINHELNFVGSVRDQAIVFVLACKGALQYSRIHGSDIFESAMQQMKLTLVNEISANNKLAG